MPGSTGKDTVTSTRGHGGDGLTSSISGTSTPYAGGGGGGSYLTTAGGLGGTGGGGNGAYRATGKYNGSNATGYGSGGGGAAVGSYVGGNGSAGIIIIRYLHP